MTGAGIGETGTGLVNYQFGVRRRSRRGWAATSRPARAYLMAKAKKKLLPKNFEETLKNRNLKDLKTLFDTHDVNARGGFYKQTALAFPECPDKLTRWLVENGADLDAVDQFGDTPLHSR